ncbi:hypothetical protein BCR34DRAFT_557391 [Clohesyomyces aquaticus]|uniref:Uncharacterized protein n=1 Tax=Clohesyomyces aquaticus TaxID=1231657 RepID=A0A1Y2A117_9PLEO|nr:hypothetical protein BCR34DRAFT_557391 [Clohesyomyces aquaticus]
MSPLYHFRIDEIEEPLLPSPVFNYAGSWTSHDIPSPAFEDPDSMFYPSSFENQNPWDYQVLSNPPSSGLYHGRSAASLADEPSYSPWSSENHRSLSFYEICDDPRGQSSGYANCVRVPNPVSSLIAQTGPSRTNLRLKPAQYACTEMPYIWDGHAGGLGSSNLDIDGNPLGDTAGNGHAARNDILQSTAGTPNVEPLLCHPCDSAFTGTYAQGNLGRHRRLKHQSMEVASVLGACTSAFGTSGFGNGTWVSDRHIRVLSRPMQALSPSFCSATRLCSNVACVLGYTISATCLYRLNKNDRYQRHAITCGFLGAICITWGSENDLEAMLLQILPWAVLFSLCLSSIAHKYLRGWNRCNDSYDEKARASQGAEY